VWDVDNQTRFATEHTWDRDRQGAETWIVLVKGTFDIAPDGSTHPADEQAPVCTVPQYHGDPSTSSLRLDTDLLRLKPTTDVLVLGHAHAPRGRLVEQIDVTLKLDALEKTLRVIGNRHWKRGGGGLRLGSPQPFERMPLVYERAFGGTDGIDDGGVCHCDERNPVGTGFAQQAARLADWAAPNVLYPGDAASFDVSSRPAPAGFGPIAAHWQPRRAFGGTYDAAWARTRKPLVPDDFDDRFYLCAPADQRPPRHLEGGELVELRNMTPAGVLRFRLPRISFGFETHFARGEPVLHRQSLHSVIIEPDTARVSMVWQSALPCHHKVLELERTEVIEKARLSPAPH
jgi:hypothetical protein